MASKKKFWFRARSAITGRFISLQKALLDKYHSVIQKIFNQEK